MPYLIHFLLALEICPTYDSAIFVIAIPIHTIGIYGINKVISAPSIGRDWVVVFTVRVHSSGTSKGGIVPTGM